MGSNYMNFKTLGYNNVQAPGDQGNNGAKPLGNFPLVPQSSVYSLTFDEFQNSLGGLGRDFGSMNMDELLKNIWTAEETQAMTSTSTLVTDQVSHISTGGNNLQRQGSLTLPRTLSQKTVDQVWRDLVKESEHQDGDMKGPDMPQRQPTLGEITLEEFLVRAGVVREDQSQPQQQIGKPNCNNGLPLGFQNYQNNNNVVLGNRIPENNNNAVLGNRIPENNNNAVLNPKPIFPKTANVAFGSINLPGNVQISSTGSARSSLLGVSESTLNNTAGTVGLGTNGVTVAARSTVNPLSSSNMKTASPLSPVPFMFGRGRRCGAALEKVVERRQRRMIKNRESAARSRARKQAYTLELEEEVAKLKEMNQELQKKQKEIVEMQKSQLLENTEWPLGGKRRCLRRTLTGPW